MKVEDFLDRYFYKEDIQDLLDTLELPISGTKDELIRRLRRANVDIFMIIGSMNKEQLKDVCRDLDLKVGGSRDELMDRVFPAVIEDWSEKQKIAEIERMRKQGWPEKDLKGIYESFGLEPPVKKKRKKEPKPKIMKPKLEVKEADEFSKLISAIKKWVPQKRHGTEEGYQLDLRAYLAYECGYDVRLEALESKTDILVDEKFPIEIKKNPTQKDYDRLIGQITRHFRAKENAIAVICDVRRLEKFKDFKHNISKLFPVNVEIIEK